MLGRSKMANGAFEFGPPDARPVEEPYTIALVLKHEAPDIGRCDARILATDIDTDVLAKAAIGEYPAQALDEIPRPYRQYLDNRGTTGAVMNPGVRSLIAFRRLNLMQPWPFKGLFDAIFCRNVMIYFDTATKAALIDRYTQAIRPGGWLYIGHSEIAHRRRIRVCARSAARSTGEEA